MNDTDKIRTRLARRRPTLGGNEVSTRYDAECGRWLVTHYLADGGEAVEELPVTDPADASGAQLAELRVINRGAPVIAAACGERAEAHVFPDHVSGHWTLFVPCTDCGGFPLRLKLRLGAIEGSSATAPSELERELARLVAYRASLPFLGHGGGEDCIGCAVEIADAPTGELAEMALSWFCPESQEWHVRLPIGNGEGVHMPLGLPAWSDPDEVERASRQIAFGVVPPYDQEAEA